MHTLRSNARGVRVILPPGMPFDRALRAGLVGRLQNERYSRWVKTLPCCCGCGRPADDPHHPYGTGFRGGATKVPDWWCIPLTRGCHDALHADVAAWEAEYGPQLQHALMTLTRAIAEGVVVAK